MSDEKLSLKEMCEVFNVTPRTLRYYEYIELLHSEKQGRNRLYGSRERARMKLILRGRRFGFSLENIRRWLLIYENEGDHAQMAVFVEAASKQIDELNDQKEELEDTLNELMELRENTMKLL